MFFLQILLTSLVTGTEVLLLAAGLYVIYAIARFFHIGLGAMMIAGGYGFYVFNEAHLPFWMAFLGGLFVGALLGMLSFYLLEPFIKKNQQLLALLTSTAFGIVIESSLAIKFGSEGKFLVNAVLPTFDFFGLRITQIGLWTLITGIIVAILAWIFIYLLPYGRVLRAISQHRQCASLIGIKEKKVQLLIFMAVGIIAALIGILTGMNDAVTPVAGLDPIAMAFMALLIGGVSDFRGTVLASYLIVLIPELIVAGTYGDLSFNASWKMVFMFLIALVALSLRPQGIFQTTQRKS